jgi:hypothetical protein
MRRALSLTIFCATAIALAPAASASAITSFNGQCDLSGTSAFAPALAVTPLERGYDFAGTGTCTGTLDGTAVDGAAVSATVSGSGTLSCLGSSSSGGAGVLTFTDLGKSLGFRLDLAGAGSEVALHVRGNNGGDGVGRASFLAGAGPETAAACAGAGAQALDFSASLRSLTVLKG